MKDLFAEIERVLPEGGDWCSLDKASTLAAMVIAMRPQVVCEIGVWLGGSLVPMLLALKQNRSGKAIAIDPWDSKASIEGEEEKNHAWWQSVDHEDIYRRFVGRLEKHGVQRICDIWRMKSDDGTSPALIDLLHVDGNHTEQAVRDVTKYGANVRDGGIMVLDDLNWSSGSVQRARQVAWSMGFADLYPLGSGIVMQRLHLPR